MDHVLCFGNDAAAAITDVIEDIERLPCRAAYTDQLPAQRLCHARVNRALKILSPDCFESLARQNCDEVGKVGASSISIGRSAIILQGSNHYRAIAAQ